MSLGKELSGGSGDVNPQLLTVSVQQSGNDVSTALTVSIPIVRLTGKNRALVFELLQVESIVHHPPSHNLAVAFSEVVNLIGVGSSIPSASLPATFYSSRITAEKLGAGFDSDWIFNPKDISDYRDGAGHGIIIATDTVTFRVDSIATDRQNIVDWRLLYRLKEVGITEYVGFVTAQMAG